MSVIERKIPLKFIGTIIGLTALTLLATVVFGYLVSAPPRGFMFWVSIGFVCTIEFLVGTLYINIYARNHCEYRPGGAIQAITYGIVGVYAVLGLISIILYGAARDATGGSDGVFAAIMLVLTTISFIAAVLLYAYDLHSQSLAKPMSDKRSEHRGYAVSLVPAFQALREITTDDYGFRRRLAIVEKKIQVVEVALSHSHGGGLGSWESGSTHPISPDQDQIIREGVCAIQHALSKICSASDVTEVVVAELERCVSELALAVDQMELN